MSRPDHLEQVPPARVAGARAVADALLAAKRIVMTTHVNADGDGLGSEIALVYLLRAQGRTVHIVNPTPVPDRYRFLVDPVADADRSAEATATLKSADLILVLDISDLSRLGNLAEAIRARGLPVACVDHHVSPGTLPAGPRLEDPSASATAELIYDLATVAGWEIGQDAARAMYVGLMTDTGGFRFANTTPRVLRVAASLLEAGVNPERIYEEVYATAPVGRIRLMADVLETLVVEHELGLSYVTVPSDALARHNVSADDLDGLVEFARSVQGTRLAMLFRHLANGKVKVSFRSVGDFDVAKFASQFGGGGHAKASGASIAGSMGDVQDQVLGAARAALAPAR
jgi:phosphoesterase RecJ-like protein